MIMKPTVMLGDSLSFEVSKEPLPEGVEVLKQSNVERAIKWNLEHPERRSEIGKKCYQGRKEEQEIYQRGYYLGKKTAVLTYYGRGILACVQCGESRMACLSIDHINGGGNEQRRLLGLKGGIHFYKWLIKNNFPEGYQTLCMNCQYVKRGENKSERSSF